MAPNALTLIVSGHHSTCELQIGVYDGISTSTTNDQELALLEGFVGAAPKGRAREKLPEWLSRAEADTLYAYMYSSYMYM